MDFDPAADAPADDRITLQEKTSAPCRQLYTFLRHPEFAAGKADPRTTVSDVLSAKNYALGAQETDQFIDLLEACRRGHHTMHFTERQYYGECTHSGIMLDFDILMDGPARQFTPDILKRLVGSIVAVLAQVVCIAADSLNTTVFVIAKPNPVKTADGGYKDGLHILLPQVWLAKPVKQLYFDLLRRSPVITNQLAKLSVRNPYPEMFDMGARANPVFYYGSCKPAAAAPYVLTGIYDVAHFPGDTTLVTVVDIDQYAVDHNLCREMALTSATPAKQRYVHLPIHDQTVAAGAAGQPADAPNEQDQLAQLLANSVQATALRNVLDLLTPHYSTDYSAWFKVLCAIAHAGGERYEPLARWFSQRVPDRYDAAGFERVWRQSVRLRGQGNNPVTERSIYFWARQCDPERFRVVQNLNYLEIAKAHVLKHDGQLTHYVVAQLLYQLAGNRFAVDVMTSRANTFTYVWYEFVMTAAGAREGSIYKWREERQPDTLHTLIPTQIDAIFRQVSTQLANMEQNAQSPELAAWYKQTRKDLKRSTTQLGMNGFQNGVIFQAQYLFRNRRFADELDRLPDCMGVGNGVLKIGREPQLYASYHEMLISKFTKTTYVEFSKENPKVLALLQTMRDIYIEPDVFLFMMFFYSTGLDGHRKPPMILFTMAGGQNGKTTAAYMTRETLGDCYSTDLKPALLTSAAERPEQANEAVMAMVDKRFCYFDEFNEKDSLNPARIKSLANPAKQSNRANYKGMQSFANTSTCQIISNYPLGCDTQDHGTWRRLYAYENKVKFTPTPDPANKYEKMERPEVIEKWPEDPEYLSAWLSILVYFNRRLHLQFGGRITDVPHETIKWETEQYRNRQDMINQFITLYVVISPGMPDMPFDILCTKYREWFATRFGRQGPLYDTTSKMFESSQIKKYIGYRGGDIKMVQGLRVRTSDEGLQPGETAFAAQRPQAVLNDPTCVFRFEDFDM